MLVVDGEGLPFGFWIESALKSEVRLAETTLATAALRSGQGRVLRCPGRLTCD